MLFKPELNETAKAAGKSVVRSVLRRMVSISITLLILGGLGYIAWIAMQQKQAANRNARPDLPVARAGGNAARAGRAGLSRRGRRGARAE